MKNLHVLPTDHPSRLRYNIKTNFWELNEFHKYHTDIKSTHNIYITSEEDIKTGDWYYNHKTDTVQKRTKGTNNESYIGFKKVILTTDRELTDGNVQPISDEFLQWFIKNSYCEFVETERLGDGKYVNFLPNGDTEEGVYENYKIIIPKEEPKKDCFSLPNCTCKESNLDAIKGLCKICGNSIIHLGERVYVEPKQERSYSEEEVLEILRKSRYNEFGIDDLEKWFNNLKRNNGKKSK